MLRRWRGAWPRRSKFFQVPPAPVAPAAPSYPPAFTEQAGSRPRGRPAPRRGAFHEPPWAAIVPAAPTWPPTFGGRSSRRAALARRRGFFAVPPLRLPPPAFGEQAGACNRLLLARRGRFYGPLPAVVPAATTLPGWVRARQKPVSARRGAFHEPPWPPVAVQPSVWRPDPVQQASRLAGRPTRRGGRFDPPWPQVAAAPSVWPPEPISSRARWAGAARRGQFAWTPPARPAGVPAFLRRARPTPWLRCRQGFTEPPWPQGPQTVWRPPFRGQAGARPRFAARLRRGRQFSPPWPQVAPPEFTPSRPPGYAYAGRTAGTARADATSGNVQAGQPSGHAVTGGTTGSVIVEPTDGEVTIG
jgi:hypothetical protein